MPYTQPGEAIEARLLAVLASTAVKDKVFPTLPTQNASTPYVCYRRTNGGGETNLGGRSLLQQYVYRVEITADDETTAEAILTAINDTSAGLAGWSDRANGVHVVLPTDDADTGVESDTLRVPGQSFQISFSG